MTLSLDDQRQQAKSPSLISVRPSAARQAFCKTVIVLLSRPINAAFRVCTNCSFACLLFVVAVVVVFFFFLSHIKASVNSKTLFNRLIAIFCSVY